MTKKGKKKKKEPKEIDKIIKKKKLNNKIQKKFLHKNSKFK